MPVLNWPHSVYYRVHKDEVHILAVWHGARDPKMLKKRFP